MCIHLDDIDYAWHTHQLVSTSRYANETSLLAGASADGVEHDDSVNQRVEGSKLHSSWAETKRMWLQTYGSGHETIDNDKPHPTRSSSRDTGIEQRGVCYRGEPPEWWFAQANAAYCVHDNFLVRATVLSVLSVLSALQQVNMNMNRVALLFGSNQMIDICHKNITCITILHMRLM